MGFSGYSDSDWGACQTSSRSTMGFCFQIASAPVSWSSKLQSRVADSPTDAEYIALSHAGKEAIFLRQILKELGISIQDATKIFGGDQGAIAFTKNPQFHQRTRHVRIRKHFVRDMVKQGEIQVVYIPTSDMVADIFTEPLGPQLFICHRENLGMR